MDSIEKRNSVKDNYNLIAEQYSNEFGVEIEDMDVIEIFKSLLNTDSKIVDLGGGPGQVTNYLVNLGYDAVCYDFSKETIKNATRLYPGLPCLLDDIINLKDHYSDNSLDGIVALYSLFHIPKEDLKQLFNDIKSVLKEDGIFCFSFQLGNGETFVDEPYLGDKGKKVLYINYLTKDEIYELLNNDYEIIYETEKRETGDNVLGEDGNDAIYIIARKKSRNIYDLVKDIVNKSKELKNKYTDEINAKVNYACIFCKNDEEYNHYIEVLKNDNNEIIEDTYSGPLFRIKDLDTVAGTLKLLKIRKYDNKHLDLGDADFTVDNYEPFKNKYIDKSNFKLISGEGYEMIELMEDGNEVRTYFSNPPLDEELGIK